MRLFRDENGQSLTETGLLLGLICVVAVAALGGVGSSVSGIHEAYNKAITKAFTHIFGT